MFAACAVAGCAGEQEALIVLNVAAPMETEDTQSGDVTCQWMAGGLTLPSGSLDVRSLGPYQMAPVLLNNLLPQAEANNNSSTDNTELQLTDRIDITLNLPSDISIDLPSAYTLPNSTISLSAGDQIVPLIDAIPADYTAALADAMSGMESSERVNASVDIVFHATRSANRRGRAGVIDSRAFTFPIELCYGCLLELCTCNDGACISEPQNDRYFGRCGRAQDADLIGQAFECAAAFPPSTSTSGSTGEDVSTGGGTTAASDGAPATGPMATGS